MKLPDISSKLTTPKPWQIAVGVGLVAFVVIVGPAITHVMMPEKKKPETKQITTVGKIGEPWHAVAFPAVVQTPMPHTPMPPPPAPIVHTPQMPPQTTSPPPLAANGAPNLGKATAPPDPEAEAIAAPILIAKAPGGEAAANAPAPGQAGQGGRGGTLQGDKPSALAGMLKPTETTGFMAERLRHPNMLIAEGRVLQCHNITRETSGLEGFVRGQIARDVWSEDDTTLLIEKDSVIFGEITRGVISGVDRMFVLWRRIETPRPNLVRITLNSPITDEMGMSGQPGDVDRHWGRKIGGALLVSGIESVFSGLSGALSNLGRGNGNNNEQGLNLNFGSVGSQGNNLANELLRTTIQIPDTMTVNQSSQCGIIVASDLDFSDVYSINKRIGH